MVVDEALTSLDQKLAAVDFDELVEEAGSRWVPPGESALRPETRAEMIERHADNASKKVGCACVCVEGGLSSFSLPGESIDHPVWIARPGSESCPRTPHGLDTEQESL